MKRFRFLKNASLLTLTGIFLRLLGMGLRIYISARIGEEGMGLYQLILSVYFLFITAAQSGLSVAVTRLCARKFALSDSLSAYRILKTALRLSLITGTAAAVSMLAFAEPISRFFIADTRCVMSLRVLALSLPFMAVCSVLSGYFIAKKNVVNGCAAQVIEQLTRMGAVVAAAAFFSKYGLEIMLAALVAANTLSEAVSCLFLALRLVLDKNRPYGRKREVGNARTVIRNAAPVAASRYLASALHTAENMLVPSAVTAYTGSRTAALSAFGALKGMALPLLFFPSSFLSALSTLLVPEISEAAARSDNRRMREIINRACSVTVTLSVMTAGVFFMFSKNLGMLIYNSPQVSFMLAMLAPIVPFMYLDGICDGLLKGLGRQKQVLYHNCIDSGARILLTLIAVPRLGINGFLWVMVLSNITVAVLNLRLLLKTAGIKCNFRGWILMPVIYLSVSAILTKILAPVGTTLLKTVLGCALFCLVYLFLAVISWRIFKVYKNN